MKGHTNFVMAVALDPTGRYGVSGSWDGLVIVWDLQEGKKFKELRGHASQVWSVAFSLDGKQVLSGSQDRTVCLWDVATAKEIRRFEGHQDRVNSVGFWGHDYAYSGGDTTARFWDLHSGKELYRTPPQPSTVSCVAPVRLQQNFYFLVGTELHGLRVWTLQKEVK